jgi:hypothetical protein
LQVDQVELQLLQGRTQVLTDEQNFYNSLDQFKLQLGLPTDLPIELDDAIVRPIVQQFQRFDQAIRAFEAAQDDAAKLDDPKLAPQLRKLLLRLFTTSAIVRGTKFSTEFPARWAAREKMSNQDLEKLLSQLSEERRERLGRKAELEKAEKPLSPEDLRRLEELDFEINLILFEQALRVYEGQPWKTETDPARQERLQTGLFRTVANGFNVLLGAARNERIVQIRQLWPELPRVCVGGVDLLQVDMDRAQTVVAQAALINRFDLMNDRAQLVDAWRQVAVAANALLGVFNVQYHMDSSTPPTVARPLDFSASRTRHQLILELDPPLVRYSERNNYRSALISYQRQRRALMAEEDFALQTVRLEIRQLRLLAEDYKIQKRAVELAYFQVENSLDTFRQPPLPGSATAGGNQAANAASLTQQLLSAQQRLPTTLNAMLTFWVNFLTFRMQLYSDMELMPLDFRGVWTDDIAACQCGPAESDRPADRATSEPGDQRPVPERPDGGRPEQPPGPQPVAHTPYATFGDRR